LRRLLRWQCLRLAKALSSLQAALLRMALDISDDKK